MSSPPNNNKDGGQPQPTPVVQTILESFTRCFNPIDVGCGKITNDSASSSNRRRSSPTNQLIGLNISSGSRAVSRSTSSNDSRKKKQLHNNMSYDADSVAKAKKSANSKMSAEAIEERSMKRKLEIFRGASSDSANNNRSGPKLAPRLSQQPTVRTSPPSSREPSPTNPIGNATAAETGQLALSDDEEELIRLQQSRKRFACGMNFPDRMARTGSPVSGIASLFRQAQKPFGLCFATPVRTASHEDVDNLSDDKLTYDEFVCRHPLAGATDKNVPQVSPEAQDNNSSYNEEETITSTLYFDQKYSHVVQTRPPMPLFQENMLEDELLSKFIPKSKSNPPEFVGQSPRRKSRGSPKTVTSGRGSPKSPKQGGARGSPKSGKRSPKNIFSMSDPPSPIKIQDDSVSMNTSQSGESMVITTDFTEDPQEPQCDVVLQPPTTAEF